MIGKYPILALLLVAATVTSAAEAPQCPTEHARYESMAEPKWRAGFQQIQKDPNWLTDVAFYVQSSVTNRKYWFLFDAGSARYINMLPTTDVMQPGWHPRDSDATELTSVSREMHYLPVDAKLGLSLTMPGTGQAAPAYILLPDLQEVMWYSMANPMEREAAPLAFFELSECNPN